jgi:hypothetical protein
VPESLVANGFSKHKVLLRVDSNGNFKVIYVNAVDEELIQEKRVFVNSKITPLITESQPIQNTISQFQYH